jgi:phytoene dehydrogenase-like protein
MRDRYDAVVVGSGPNGLAAAITLARAGRSVLVLEAKETVGGGTRSAELTLPGFVHDVCSAVHPLAVGSPFFKSLPLERFGLDWIHPPASVAHPLDDGTAVIVQRSIEATSETLGVDATAYRRLMKPLVADWDHLAREFLGPLRFPRHPITLARFAPLALLPAATLAKIVFRGERARALFAGMACHSIMPLEQITTAAFGLMLNITAHAVGWPIPKGGSQSIANALAANLKSLGGEIVTGCEVKCLDQLPPQNAPHQAVLLDVTPHQLDRIAGDQLPASYRRKLQGYRYGPGVFKIDFALDGPIPWRARDCAQAATVHVGGTLEEIAMSERAVGHGQHPERPFVLVAQSSLFDPTRAPEGKHTVWAYCHVPNGSSIDMSERIIAQIERFAPGFRDRILAQTTRTSQEMERYNPNYIGGDINGGVQDWRQLFTRPVARINPYTTPTKGIYLCSSSTPPGGGVHGMCGYHAAHAVLQTNSHR